MPLGWQMVLHFLVNMSLGLVSALVGFLFSLWGFIRSYQPDFLTGTHHSKQYHQDLYQRSFIHALRCHRSFRILRSVVAPFLGPVVHHHIP
jgi:hypothetical protein